MPWFVGVWGGAQNTCVTCEVRSGQESHELYGPGHSQALALVRGVVTRSVTRQAQGTLASAPQGEVRN